jgi:CO dehydrogenase maturation factor
MAVRIAVAGKGGSGKTTLCALLCRALMERGVKPVLAVDADPNSCLPERLGVTVRQTIGEMREQVRDDPESVPPGVSKHAWIEQLIQEDIAEASGFDLLVMGRQEGPGCYCYINNVLRDSMEKLSAKYRAVVVDNEAGLEHLSRRTNGRVEVMLVVCLPNQTGVHTAARILRIIKSLELEVGHTFLVFSQCDGVPGGDLGEAVAQLGVEVLGTVPADSGVNTFDVTGRPLLQLPAESRAVQAVRGFVTTLVERKLL